MKSFVKIVIKTGLRRRLQRQRNYTIPMGILDISNPLEGLSEEDIFDRYRFFPVTIIFHRSFT